MSKKWLFVIILVLTCLAIALIIILKSNTKYNKLIISDDKWDSIINSRTESTSLIIEDIEFNDYNLMIDEKNSVIYYSIVNSSNKYNPSIRYKTNEKMKIAINDNITDEKLEKTDVLKILIYNDKEYRIYNLVATNYPLLNINYKDDTNNKIKISMNLELFDNHVDSHQRVLKSEGKLRILKEDEEYSFSLTKESLGHNKRENHVSIFGMEKRDEYLIKVTNATNDDERYVQFFLNGEYKGLYSFGPKEGRRIDNYERNRENNK